MHREPDITAPTWVPLQKADERLFRYLGDFTQFTLNQLLTRGRVPVLSVRRDVVGALPDRVEGLLANASSIDVVSHNNWILAHYRFASEQDAQKVLGPQSCFTWGAPASGGLIVNLDFDQVQLCWATLIGELRRVGRIPADEAALRKLGLWPDSWGPIGSGAADEPPRSAEAQRGTLRPAPSPEIHKAIAAAYDEAEAAGKKPPNILEIVEPVQVRLTSAGYHASGRQIRELAGDRQHDDRRWKPGQTKAM